MESSVVVPQRVVGSVTIQSSDLDTLFNCLERAVDAQKRLSENMTFFIRQLDDERRILQEAKTAVTELRMRAAIAGAAGARRH